MMHKGDLFLGLMSTSSTVMVARATVRKSQRTTPPGAHLEIAKQATAAGLPADVFFGNVSIFHLSHSTGAQHDVDYDLNLLYQQFAPAASADERDGTEVPRDAARVLEFLEHFETLLRSVDNVKERLTKRTTQAEEVSDQPAPNDDTLNDSERNRTADIGDYEDSGTFLKGTIPSEAAKHDIVVNKTIVFSGSGSVQRTTVLEKDEERIETHSTAPSSGCYIASQGTVLRELQQRLAQLDPAEEVDANGNDVLNEVADAMSVSSREVPEATAAPMFLSVSGSILSELKSTLHNKSDPA